MVFIYDIIIEYRKHISLIFDVISHCFLMVAKKGGKIQASGATIIITMVDFTHLSFNSFVDLQLKYIIKYQEV